MFPARPRCVIALWPSNGRSIRLPVIIGHTRYSKCTPGSVTARNVDAPHDTACEPMPSAGVCHGPGFASVCSTTFTPRASRQYIHVDPSGAHGSDGGAEPKALPPYSNAGKLMAKPKRYADPSAGMMKGPVFAGEIPPSDSARNCSSIDVSGTFLFTASRFARGSYCPARVVRANVVPAGAPSWRSSHAS